jgi:hypothetical protein
MKRVTRLLVAPPESLGHSLKAHLHHKNPKTQFWHYSGNVKLETEQNHFSGNSDAYATWLTI